jgi:rsbT co-antagonist protein RsbR
MLPNTEHLARFWRDYAQTFVDGVMDDFVARSIRSYPEAVLDAQRENVNEMVRVWLAALEANSPTPLTEFIKKLSIRHANDGKDIDDVMLAVDLFRHHIWRLMKRFYAAGDWDMDVVELVERWIHENRKAIVSGFNEKWREGVTDLAERERALEAQRQLIQELSAPIVPIHAGVLLLPLVGAVDSRRATQIMESALEQIVRYQADVLILDITGVPLVDTGVANYLIQMARAVTLLGARVALVGIGAEIAQTVVQLGVDLRDIIIRANLQDGISYALALQGHAIRSLQTPELAVT